MAGPIVVSIVGDNRRLSSAVDSSKSKLGSLGGIAKAGGLAVAAGLAVAGAAAVKFGVDSVKAASDSQQSLGATQTVFGKFADDVIARSEKASQAIGVSANEYRELSNVVGASLTGAGVPLEKAAGLTDKLNRRAADLAATFGGSTSDAVSAFSSLLRGEADPIERYGISVKQSDVNARLAAQGLDGLTGSALKQAEMQARLDLAMQQSTKSAGAFGRESGTLANRQQVLGAMWEDLQAKAGQVLLPMLTRLASFVIDRVIPAFERFGPPVMALAKDMAGRLAPIISNVAGILASKIVPAVQNAAGRFRDMKPTVDRIVNAAAELWPVVAKVAGTIASVLISAVSRAIPIVGKIAATILETGVAAVNAIAGFVRFAKSVGDKVGEAIAFVRGIPDKVKGAMSGAASWLVSAGRDVMNGLVAGLEAGKQWVIDKIQEIADVIPGWVKKRLGIASPSKVMAQIGRWTTAGLVAGLREGESGVTQFASSIADKLESSWKRLGLPEKAKRRGQQIAGALAGVKDEVAQLRTHARDYEALANKLDQARQLASGVRSSAIDSASIAGLGEREIQIVDTSGQLVTQTVGPTGATIAEDLQAKLQALQEFTRNVDALRQAGLNQTSVDQLIKDGVERGSVTASALVAGGPEALAAVNAVQSQIDAAATQLGDVAAVNMYGTGQQAAAGFVDGLASDLEGIDKAARRIARQMVRAIKRELKIKSPSRVARDLARSFTDGIVVQTKVDGRRAELAGGNTARALLDGFGKPRAQLDAEAVAAGGQRLQLVRLELTAEQLDQLQRGAQIRADLDAWDGVGGRASA